MTKGDVHCTASDALCLFNVIRLFLVMRVMHDRMSPVLRAACLCYMALCAVLDMLTSHDVMDPNVLYVKIKRHIELFVAVYGKDAFLPKHHFSLHLAAMLSFHKILICLFTNERKHKEIKRYATPQHSMIDILKSVTSMQFRALERPQGMSLVEPYDPPEFMLRFVLDNYPVDSDTVIQTAREACASTGLRCVRHDVVYASCSDTRIVGQVKFHLSIDGVCWTCIVLWQALPQRHAYTALKEHKMIHTDDITHVCIYRLNDAVAYVLPPSGFD